MKWQDALQWYWEEIFQSQYPGSPGVQSSLGKLKYTWEMACYGRVLGLKLVSKIVLRRHLEMAGHSVVTQGEETLHVTDEVSQDSTFPVSRDFT